MSNPETTETASDLTVSASVCVVGVLAEALAQHEFAPQKGADHVGCFGCDWVSYGIFPRSEHAAHVASVVAALPNIAIIELPEREKGVWFVGDGQSHVERVAGSAMWVRDSANNIVHIPNPRGLALALLAATQAGEKS